MSVSNSIFETPFFARGAHQHLLFLCGVVSPHFNTKHSECRARWAFSKICTIACRRHFLFLHWLPLRCCWKGWLVGDAFRRLVIFRNVGLFLSQTFSCAFPPTQTSWPRLRLSPGKSFLRSFFPDTITCGWWCISFLWFFNTVLVWWSSFWEGTIEGGQPIFSGFPDRWMIKHCVSLDDCA